LGPPINAATSECRKKLKEISHTHQGPHRRKRKNSKIGSCHNARIKVPRIKRLGSKKKAKTRHPPPTKKNGGGKQTNARGVKKIKQENLKVPLPAHGGVSEEKIMWEL